MKSELFERYQVIIIYEYELRKGRKIAQEIRIATVNESREASIQKEKQTQRGSHVETFDDRVWNGMRMNDFYSVFCQPFETRWLDERVNLIRSTRPNEVLAHCIYVRCARDQPIEIEMSRTQSKEPNAIIKSVHRLSNRIQKKKKEKIQ